MDRAIFTLDTIEHQVFSGTVEFPESGVTIRWSLANQIGKLALSCIRGENWRDHAAVAQAVIMEGLKTIIPQPN